MRLRATAGSFTGNRQGGDFADPRTYDEIQKGKPSVEKNDNKVNFTQQQMQETLALCRQGEKLEPQNAYFTWMRIFFLMTNWQDEEAIKALSEAASKSYWNNHSAEFQQLYANAAEGVLGRPLTSYEKMMVISLPLDLKPNARMREMGRILSWQGVKFKRAGKNDKAVVLWANVYHVMTLALQGDDIPIDFFVDYAIAAIASGGSSYPSKAQMDASLINNLIAFANKYHRPDLARQIEKDWKANHELFQQLRAYFKKSDYSRPFVTIVEATVILLQCTVLTILSLAGALLGWMLLNIVSFRNRGKSTFTENAINHWDQCKGIFACSGLSSFILGTLFLALVVAVKDSITPANFGWGWGALDIFQKPINITSLSDAIDILSNTSDITYYPSFWRLLVFTTPLICGALFAFVHSRSKKQKSTFLHKIGGNIYLALLFLAWGIIALTSEYGLTQTILAAICGIFLLLSFLRMWWQTRDNSDVTFSTFRITLAGWICTGSVWVLILLISQSAINHKLQPWANNQLRGEMHQLHDVRNTP